MLTVHELSKELNLSESYVYQLIAKQRIPHYKVGRAIRFEMEKIKKWMSDKEIKVGSKSHLIDAGSKVN